ncbi:MAG: type II toxin-antitoxin system RelE/ParE family toxin [Bryobacteraceae bacterium]
MRADLTLAPEEDEDIAAAYAWYESRRIDLGEDFLSALEAALEGIRRQPDMHAIVHEDYRRALIRRFPYAIFYEHATGKVTVYAVFHTSRGAFAVMRSKPAVHSNCAS